MAEYEEYVEAGRELDKLVAEKVFGQTVVEHKPFGRVDFATKNDDGSLTVVPRYSEHIASAWLVVERMNGFILSLQGVPGEWSAEFTSIAFQYAVRAEFEAAPHAICLAALRACAPDLVIP